MDSLQITSVIVLTHNAYFTSCLKTYLLSGLKLFISTYTVPGERLFSVQIEKQRGEKSKLDSPVKVVSKSDSSLQTYPRKVLKSERCVSDVLHNPFTVTASFILVK